MQTGTFAKIVFLSGALAGMGACASAQAKGTDTPPLNVPAPPPHTIELPSEPLEPVAEIPNAPGGTTPAASRPARPAAPKPQGSSDAKPDAKPDTPASPPANETPVPPPPPTTPNPQLRTPQTADTSTAAKSVRTTIDRAKNTLHNVNYNPLSNERKKAYKDAQLFIQQAEDALKEGNIVFAQANAAKAETLARELAGR